jgi:hypothetical protein
MTHNKDTSNKYCIVCDDKVIATHNICIFGVSLSVCYEHYIEFVNQEEIIEQFDIEDYARDFTTEY